MISDEGGGGQKKNAKSSDIIYGQLLNQNEDLVLKNWSTVVNDWESKWPN